MSDTTVDTVGTADTEPAAWVPWRVAPDSGFEVDQPHGNVGIVQIDPTRFLALNAFRFSDPEIEQDLIDHLVADGATEAVARTMVDEARTFTPREDNPTDLASIPRFMRWFENPYGRHSLAALLHDELITSEVNGGALGSDTLSDRFFRQMMGASGVPRLKRWIMWAAVALRTRFAAGGVRRWSVLVWAVLGLFGIVCGLVGAGAWIFDWSTPVDPGWLVLVALALPVVSAGLWGEQWRASLVAAIAGFWLIPAAAVAALGYFTYVVLEHLAHTMGYD